MAILSIDTLTGVNNIPSFLPAATIMLFKQSSAPTSWTKLTTHDNKALRVVSGTVTSGGTNPFLTEFSPESPVPISNTISGSTTLTGPQLPSHTHPGSNSSRYYGGPTAPQAHGPGPGPFAVDRGPSLNSGYINNTGGSGSHFHPLTSTTDLSFALAYVDVILCSKDS